MKKIIILLLITLIYSCSDSEDDTKDLIVGNWKLEKMVENGNDYTNECVTLSTMRVDADLTLNYTNYNNVCIQTTEVGKLLKVSESIFKFLNETSNDNNDFYTTFSVEGINTLRQTYSDPIGVNYQMWRRN